MILGIYENRKAGRAASVLNECSEGILERILKREKMTGKPGETLLINYLPGCRADRILLVGLGKKQNLIARDFRKALNAAFKAARATGAKNIVTTLHNTEVSDASEKWKARQLAEVFESGGYSFSALKSESTPPPSPAQISAFCFDKRNLAAIEEGLAQGLATGQGVNLARELANLPGNVCTPTYLAKQAASLAKKKKALSVKVLDEKEMQKLGMGSLLSVSRGSRQPAKLIVMEYFNGAKGSRPTVLVGKGLTFDAGGISLKPAPAMDEMKYDMCGGASVIGAMSAIAELEMPLNVVGIVPSSENMPDGDANKPGDIVTSMSGRTIEILNTDAEGRLILCDALTYAERYEPDDVIDMATLTGACIIALGHHPSGLMGNDDALCESLINAGEKSLDRVWRLPLWDEYQDQLKSNFADIANIGGKDAGTITAACFLSRFTRDFKWAHLDIAGTAWVSGKNKGATGRPVPLLIQFLLNKYETE